MKELTSFSLYSRALKLQQALASAGIEATITSEATNSYIGTLKYTVWVAEGACPADLDRICKSEASPDPAESPVLHTTVSISEGLTKCRSCGYDLRGQIADGKCPECGRPYVLVVEKRCPQCGAEVPRDFDVCWRCNAELPPESPSNS